MGNRARGRYRCKCDWCRSVTRDKFNRRFEAKLVDEALVPDEENIYDSWYDWEKEYDL
jgi:hypothetical protein